MPQDPLKIGLFWQGAEAERACTYLQGEFLGWWNRTYLSIFGAIKFDCAKDGTGGAHRLICNNAIDLVLNCDCAIAIQGFEERCASDRAGNLWVEVGLWLGYRGDQGLLLAVKRDSRPPPVQPPEMINGRECAYFETDEQLREHVFNWILGLFQARATLTATNGRSRMIERVQETLGDGFAAWVAEHANLCNGKPWTSSSDVLVLTAELLRMGRAARELANLSSHLVRVGMAARDLSLEERDREEMEPARKALRQQAPAKGTRVRYQNSKARRVREEIRRLEDMVKRQLQRKYPKEQQGKEPYETWHCLTMFLLNRLNAFSKAHAYPGVVLVPKPKDLELWVKNFVNEATQFELERRLERGLSLNREETLKDVQEFADDAFRLARFVDDLRSSWFEVTSVIMKDKFENFTVKRGPGSGSPEDVLRSLGEPLRALAELCTELPHNLPQNRRWPVPIWRES